MPFYLSPSVNVLEKDLTSIVPAVSTSVGAFAGVFQWGPVLDPVTVTSENVLVQRFGKPTNGNYHAFFTAANFLSYSNNLLLIRADAGSLRNACSNLKELSVSSNLTVPDGGTTVTSGSSIIGKISVTDILKDADGQEVGVVTAISSNGLSFTLKEGAKTQLVSEGDCTVLRTIKIKNQDDYLSQYADGNNGHGPFAAKYPGTLGNSLKVSIADNATFGTWAYKSEFDSAPGSTDYAENVNGSDDGVHVVVVDEDGLWTGVMGYVLEKFAYASKASDAVKSDGTNNYYKNVINNNSKYIVWMDHPIQGVHNWGSQAANVSFTNLENAVESSLDNGLDDYTPTTGELIEAFSMFANDELYDISLIMCGKANPVISEYVIQNVAEVRKDCVAFVSPENVQTGEVIQGNGSDAVDYIVEYRNELPSSSYGVMDTGFKYQYDRYNDVYRWVPLNGDIAGLCARTDYTNDAWWSPAGYNRGQIKSVVKLAVNPARTERDNLYKNGINPIVNFPGNGVVLFGDKTLLAKPSAFDRINVRRLFIVLEKAIATASKYQLFEFNDGFTRAQFRNLVEPFLRDVQGRRGVYDFRVKCDETNNTGEVIDRNEFVADIYIKPARSINFITLTFVAARTAISFEEIGA